MNKYLIWIPLILFLVSCSKDDNSIVADTDYTATGFLMGKINTVTWSADKIEAHKEASTIYITGTKNYDAGSLYSASKINFRIINLTQPVTAGIGENEPGYQYFVKANYTLTFTDGSKDKVYTAYYRNYSLMNLTRINDKGIDATFIFKAYSGDFSDSVIVTDGVFKIDY
ncbi:hypothetical protein BMS3Abin03_00162 [bacterium BMS3Abin03]|nr:hypothetical protein BMS3Abin03_00162 [bacterium BMS3Abin03]